MKRNNIYALNSLKYKGFWVQTLIKLANTVRCMVEPSNYFVMSMTGFNISSFGSQKILKEGLRNGKEFVCRQFALQRYGHNFE
jgi:hypothetical protein